MYKIVFFISIISAWVLISGCSKEDADFRLSTLQTPVVTGFYMRDEYGYPYGTVGIPNVKTQDGGSYETSDHFMTCYPNPSNNMISLLLKSQEKTKHVWLVRATAGESLMNSMLVQGQLNVAVAGGFPLFQVETESKHLNFDLSQYEQGYYRIYVKMGEEIWYDNIVIIRNINTDGK